MFIKTHSSGYYKVKTNNQSDDRHQHADIMGCMGGGGAKDGEDKARKEKSKQIEKELEKDKQKYKATHRLLLLGQ